MPDSDQQLSDSLDRSQSPSLFVAVVSDSYTLLLVVALLALLVSLAVLVGFWIDHYGLGSKPVIGQITSVSANQARVDLGSRQGPQPGKDGPGVILAKGDTVVFSPPD